MNESFILYIDRYDIYIIGSTADDQKFFLEEATSALQASKTYQIKICAGTKSTKFSTVFEVRTPPPSVQKVYSLSPCIYSKQ